MYLCNVQMCLHVEIKVTVYRKHLVFCDSFVRVKICQILVNFKEQGIHMKFEIFQSF